MALIKCCECGSEISDKALVCMNYGKPIKCNNNNTIIKKDSNEKYDIISLCGFIIGAIARFFGNNCYTWLVLSIIGFNNVTNNNYKIFATIGIVLSGIGLLIRIIQLILLIFLWGDLLGHL